MRDKYFEKFVEARDVNNAIIWFAMLTGFIAGFLLAFMFGGVA